jgi:hypothetical protein
MTLNPWVSDHRPNREKGQNGYGARLADETRFGPSAPLSRGFRSLESFERSSGGWAWRFVYYLLSGIPTLSFSLLCRKLLLPLLLPYISDTILLIAISKVSSPTKPIPQQNNRPTQSQLYNPESLDCPRAVSTFPELPYFRAALLQSWAVPFNLSHISNLHNAIR